MLLLIPTHCSRPLIKNRVTPGLFQLTSTHLPSLLGATFTLNPCHDPSAIPTQQHPPLSSKSLTVIIQKDQSRTYQSTYLFWTRKGHPWCCHSSQSSCSCHLSKGLELPSVGRSHPRHFQTSIPLKVALPGCINANDLSNSRMLRML